LYTLPEPGQTYEASVEEDKGSGVSEAKTVREMAGLELEGMLREIEGMALEDSHKAAGELMRGVGRWTAYVSLMAGLGLWSAQPIDSLLRTLERLGVRCDPGVFRERPHVAGYLSVAVLFGEEALRGRYFRLGARRC